MEAPASHGCPPGQPHTRCPNRSRHTPTSPAAARPNAPKPPPPTAHAPFPADGLVHKRFPVGPIAELPAMKRIVVAHKLHHR